MGIVTWATLRAELLPSVEDPHILVSSSLDALIPYVYEVQRGLLGEQSFIVNARAAAMLLAHEDSARLDALQRALPPFLCLQNVAGFERLPRERLEYQRNDIDAHARRHGLKLQRALDPVSARELLSRSTQSSDETEWRRAPHGGCISIFFLSTLDRAPELTRTVLDCAAEHGIEERSLGLYVQPIVQNHGCHIELIISYDPRASDAHERMQRVERDAVGRLLDTGAFFGRPYGTAERIFAKNPANFGLIREVKSLFDPNRVLHRGKWGL
jgi:FAD/FMN-containing dehydrogenase